MALNLLDYIGHPVELNALFIIATPSYNLYSLYSLSCSHSHNSFNMGASIHDVCSG